MHLIQAQSHSRRSFLRRSAQLAATGAAYPMAMNLALLSDAAAQCNPLDYKALVCVFLYGGNDYANTLVAYDSANHASYSSIRTNIAIPRAELDATVLNPSVALPNGLQYALHPSMTGLSGLFNAGQAAVVLNVGPLIQPTTKAMYRSSNRVANPLPPKLFSHNDQQALWQSSSPEGSTIGWGGNIGDMVMQQNAQSLFTCISVTGNAVFLSGDSAQSYQVGSGGPVKISSVGNTASPYGFNDVGKAMLQLTTGPRSHMLEAAYNEVTRRASESEGTVSAAVDATKSVGGVFPAPYNNLVSSYTLNGATVRNSLADQLRMVARLIAARQALGNKRQVFLVSLGGFDLHDDLMPNQPKLMKSVSDAMTAFQSTMVALGVDKQVTAFTASDFGRTLANNGDGSDHGWGGHHIIVGGAVKGGRFYGTAPPLGNGSLQSTADVDLWQVGQGRLLPTTSVDQYAATLAKWFGVSDAQLLGTAPNYKDAILPNLHRFGPGSLTVGGVSYNYERNLACLG
jgi:uncharacterized protein (DUF1501 family)